MKFALLALAASLIVPIANPISGHTMEEVAVAAGKLAGGYTRASFLCKAAGIPMPDYQDINPQQVRISPDMHKRYPEYFKLGWMKGWDGAQPYPRRQARSSVRVRWLPGTGYCDEVAAGRLVCRMGAEGFAYETDRRPFSWPPRLTSPDDVRGL
ncbi:hypothetical protein ABIA00_005482 [Bradyrhizobium ottawaense]|uniref:hypothetical protein n=2 Tax=Bradyrhizobium ottawaense TaxID=931866 RepID=UPI003835E3A3